MVGQDKNQGKKTRRRDAAGEPAAEGKVRAGARPGGRRLKPVRRPFLLHVILSLSLGLILLAMNLAIGRGTWWSLPVFFALAVILGAHALHASGLVPWLSPEWEARNAEKAQKLWSQYGPAARRKGHPSAAQPPAPSEPAQIGSRFPEAEVIAEIPPRRAGEAEASDKNSTAP
ncbi:2TM domain-containing protein [Radicibacter daui]|uniref:2TM domain-containing protein n=1 Tax=Radicibacter daui TaxID=3064829 RepID=UPI004046CFCA